jgi:spermidine/putrescine-binding protein
VDFQTKYPNVDVNFEIGASDADIYSKMAAGDQADIFHPYTGWIQFYVDEGLVEEIDTSKLSNCRCQRFQEDWAVRWQAVRIPRDGDHLFSSHGQGPGR